ncbi:MAG: hypothetical protein J6Y35_06795 [Bacteroidales bacterium]|nr:hypothetical protein [Bacteroidales bacterium]
MSDLDQLFKSKGYKAFMRKLLSFSITVLILGLLFTYKKWPGGLVMAEAGGGTLFIILILYIIEKLKSKDSEDNRDNPM